MPNEKGFFVPGDSLELTLPQKRLWAELRASPPVGCGMSQGRATRVLAIEEGIDSWKIESRHNMEQIGHCLQYDPQVVEILQELEEGDRTITKKALRLHAKYAYLKSVHDKAAYVMSKKPDQMNFAEQQNWDKYAQELGRFAGEGPESEERREQKKLMEAIRHRIMEGAGQVIDVTPERDKLPEKVRQLTQGDE